MRRTVVLSIAAIALAMAVGYGWRAMQRMPSTVIGSAQTTTAGTVSSPSPAANAGSAGSASSVPSAPPIAARVRKAQYDPNPLPPGPVRDYLPALLAAANAPNATAEANWNAFEALNACRSEKKLAELKAAQQEQEAAGKGDKPVQPKADSGPDCRGVPEKDLADAMRYLKRAAERGDDRAVYQYATGLPLRYMDRADLIEHPEAVLEWRADSTRYLTNAIDSGSTDAMFAMSRAYELGTLGEKDPVLAYQYALAWRQLAYSADNTGVDVYPNQLAAHLTPEERARAQQGAQALIARCCGTK